MTGLLPSLLIYAGHRRSVYAHAGTRRSVHIHSITYKTYLCVRFHFTMDDKLVDFVCPASIDIVPVIGGLGWTYEYMDCAMKKGGHGRGGKHIYMNK